MSVVVDNLITREVQVIMAVAGVIRALAPTLPEESNVRTDFLRWATEMSVWAEQGLREREEDDRPLLTVCEEA